MRRRPLYSAWLVTALAILLTHAAPVLAHEIRPALLEITEQDSGRIEVMWKVPMRGGMVLAIEPVLPSSLTQVGPTSDRVIPGARIQRMSFKSEGGSLVGQEILIGGLSSLQIDVLLRITLAEGSEHTAILRPASASFLVPERASSMALAWSYLRIGVKHILEGIDHLLFVLGLLLIVKSTSTLIKTITSFTVAHSITLAIATLGYASTPLPPLNVLIALSILFLGPEIVRVWRGQTSLTIRHPWVVAFAFGLLHGFGFASGLKTVGLPSYEIAGALLFFNVGVEVGQLLFVATILAMVRSFCVMELRWPRWAELAPGYTVGSLGAFWTIQRAIMMF